MIREDLRIADVRRLHLALSEPEVAQLRHLAVLQDGWKPDRQVLGHYFKLCLFQWPCNPPRTAADRKSEFSTADFYAQQHVPTGSRELIRDIFKRLQFEVCDFQGQEQAVGWDMYLLYYPTRSSIPAHQDAVKDKHIHVRANVIVTDPVRGGQFYVRQNRPDEIDPEYGYTDTGDRDDFIPTVTGGGVVFAPSKHQHGVTQIEQGDRLVVSVGAVFPQLS